MTTAGTPRNQSSDNSPEDPECDTADPRWKQAIAEYPDYASAQAAVDRLADAGFPSRTCCHCRFRCARRRAGAWSAHKCQSSVAWSGSRRLPVSSSG